MAWRIQGIIGGFLGLLLVFATPAAAQRKCNSTQNAAVQCFVTNAVNTGLATVPPGMTMYQFQAYGIAVSNIVQDPKTLAFVLGATSAVSDALPPTNADGTSNQAAQDAAVNAIIDAALSNGLIALPVYVTSDQLKQFAREAATSMRQNTGPTLAVGSVLRLLDSFIVNATSGGTVNWTQVSTNISTLIDGFVAAGVLKVPSSSSVSSIKQFGNGVAQVIYNYKLATRRTTL